ncbi:hypothetical protein RIR_jg997.t1 [Rhizophagus irregularis DAOM 181602=DAOM 197198]|nr:hypothetical protein RIR_jg997.t1 [Rhizophagus irregularis DAOM 181602=DAOM 197198]
MIKKLNIIPLTSYWKEVMETREVEYVDKSCIVIASFIINFGKISKLVDFKEKSFKVYFLKKKWLSIEIEKLPV